MEEVDLTTRYLEKQIFGRVNQIITKEGNIWTRWIGELQLSITFYARTVTETFTAKGIEMDNTVLHQVIPNLAAVNEYRTGILFFSTTGESGDII